MQNIIPKLMSFHRTTLNIGSYDILNITVKYIFISQHTFKHFYYKITKIYNKTN